MRNPVAGDAAGFGACHAHRRLLLSSLPRPSSQLFHVRVGCARVVSTSEISEWIFIN